MLYAICHMLYAICFLLYAICYMLYAICYMLYQWHAMLGMDSGEVCMIFAGYERQMREFMESNIAQHSTAEQSRAAQRCDAMLCYRRATRGCTAGSPTSSPSWTTRRPSSRRLRRCAACDLIGTPRAPACIHPVRAGMACASWVRVLIRRSSIVAMLCYDTLCYVGYARLG